MKTLSLHVAIILAFAAFLALNPKEAHAACTPTGGLASNLGTYIQFTGSCTLDDEELVVTGAMGAYDACMLVSTGGAVDVFVTLIGTTTYTTAPLSLQDFGATNTDPVLVTAAGRVYGFVGKFNRIKILQNGDPDAAVTMNCWKL
jgi:hypothetical protein